MQEEKRIKKRGGGKLNQGVGALKGGGLEPSYKLWLIIRLKNSSLQSSNHTYMDLLYKLSVPWNLIQKRVFLVKLCSLERKWEF